ncbi:hypothetical protein AMS68_001407 [Peltaster fructicola]|uniref:Uncharacterized protein n=1 Tax=Peltaster fructicola TaxID=286661 RepID=A0A6H0XN21_9PEZI|nr:hypothetical protein AMS68_001407 [Peltaster fructicola]
MPFSKSTRISILLAIDTVFFLIELITGYAVHSLALVADAFHMLNDVLSLCVGLWAVRVANSRSNEKQYTYGWQRAETLGALLNGVFLVALCVSIFLEAIQRFVEPQEVTQPKLILIVGCLGLASNLLGLLLFHDHSHGPGGHSHSHGDAVSNAEEGHSHEHNHDHDHATEEAGTRHSRRYSNIQDMPVQPSYIRQSIIAASTMHDDDEDDTHEHETDEPLLSQNGHAHYGSTKRKSLDHAQHIHKKPKEESSGGHGHSHGDLNMRGVFLHVLGDALGNIGVIGTALFIWLTDFSWRFYADPLISLVITAIILASAIPLCKAASRILLQAVPAGINIDDIRADIETLPGIYSCHHIHVWQLSDTKLIASLHIRVAMDFKNEDAARYMDLAREVRKCLHGYGIHSVTMQPEFCLDQEHDHSQTPTAHDEQGPSRTGSKAGSVCENQACLLECDENCGPGNACCTPANAEPDAHDHDHDHSH